MKNKNLMRAIFDLDTALREAKRVIKEIKAGNTSEELGLKIIRSHLSTIQNYQQEYRDIDEWPSKVWDEVKSLAETYLDPEAFQKLYPA